MKTMTHRDHARAKPLGAFIFRTAGMYGPAFEGIIRAHVATRMMDERQPNFQQGIVGLLKSSAARLEEKDGGKERWMYTKRHSQEVAVFSYMMAREAAKHQITDSIDPKLCFIGGFVHDIGKTFLPMALVVKELGIDFHFFRLFKGSRMTELELKILREEHLSAGTRYVRLFEGNGDMKTILDMVGLHHVMFDGRHSTVPSYPTHIEGTYLPLHARMAKTADFISAVLPRHYRKNAWAFTLQDTIPHAIALAGTELDPLCVGCFITATHDIGLNGAVKLIERLKHPEGHGGVSEFEKIRQHVNGVVLIDSEYGNMAKRWDIGKVLRYYDEVGYICREHGLVQFTPPVVEH